MFDTFMELLFSGPGLILAAICIANATLWRAPIGAILGTLLTIGLFWYLPRIRLGAALLAFRPKPPTGHWGIPYPDEVVICAIIVGMTLIWIPLFIRAAIDRSRAPRRPRRKTPTRGFPVVTASSAAPAEPQLEPGAVLTPKARRAMEARRASQQGDYPSRHASNE